MLNRNASGTENIKITKANRKNRKRKEEKKASDKKYRETHKEEIKAHNKARYEANKEEIKAQQKTYYEANKEKIKAKNKAYRETRKEEIKAYSKAYYEDHKEEKKACNKAYRETHKEEKKAYNEAYRETHKEEIKAQQKTYKANKRKREALEASEPASKKQKRGIDANTVSHANASEQQRTTPFNEKTELGMCDAIFESIQQMEASGYFGYLNLDDRNTQQQNYFTNNRSSFSGNLHSDVNLTGEVSNVSDQQVNPGYSSSELLFGNIAPIHQQQIVDPPVEDSREVVTGFSLSTTNNNYYRNTITSKQLLFGSNVRATNLAAANTHQASVEQPPLFPQEQDQSEDAFIDSFFNNSPTR